MPKQHCSTNGCFFWWDGSSMARLSDILVSSYQKKSSILHCFVQHCKHQEHNPNVKRGLTASQKLGFYFLSNSFQKNTSWVQFQTYNSSVLTLLCVKILRSNTAESPWSSSHHFCMIDIKLICSKNRSSGRKL